jgi:hypothetical protein
MASWTPPKFSYFKKPDGTFLAIDEKGEPRDCQPTLTTQMVDGTESVVDPWGNVVEEYEPPPYTIHVVTNWPSGMQHGVAVDADGVPLPLVPTVEVMRTGVNHADVMLADGTEVAVPMYSGPEKFHIHVEWSSTRLEQGTPDHVLVAVDANGAPLPVQPQGMGGDPTDVSSLWAAWGGGPVSVPPYEFPEFSVHLEYPETALRGAASAPPIPIAMGTDGKPLATQPTFEVDPTDPTKVVAILPDGATYDPPTYEFPPFRVHLEYSEASYSAAAAPIPVPIAVDEDGVPLAVQPHLKVDPSDHTQVTATFPDWTTARVEVQTMPKDFFVFVEASGPPSVHGAQTFAAVAVDASGTPLPIQPHFQDLDPMDLSKVTAVFPDGSVYEPPPLYPPPGVSPDRWPPDPWPPVEVAPSEDEDTGTAEDAGVDEVVGADLANDLDDSTDAADTAEPVVAEEDVADELPVAPQGENEDEALPPADVPMRSFTGVHLEEGEVLVDDDWSEGESREQEVSTEQVSEQLLTAGLNDSVSGGEVVSATPIPLPGEEMPVGGEVSVLSIPIPPPPTESDVDDGGTALDLTGDDVPANIGVEGTPAADDAELRVGAIEEVQVEEVRLEEVEADTIESVQPMTESDEPSLEGEDLEELDN